MKNKAINLLLFISAFVGAFALFSNFTINAGSLAGTSATRYQPFHNVFRDRESATGVVRLDNGFTVLTPASGTGSTHGSSVLMDTCVSVSGAIDLRETNTVILLSDLRLDSGVTLSTSGRFFGYDRAIVLGGDLEIPANKVIHFGGRVVIDGGGNTIKLNDNAQLFVDNNSTLTLRNLIISNSKNYVGNPAIKVSSSASQLALDNVILDITGDFYFDRGSIFFYNDVAFTGTSAFVYRSSWPSYITPGAKLDFDIDTTFDFRPSTTGTPGLLAKDLLNMQDVTSQLYLNGCMLKTTLTGMRLTTGQVLFDNKVSLTSQAAQRLVDYTTTITGWVYHGESNGAVYNISWHPSGRYVAVAGPNAASELTLFYFDGTSLAIMGSTYDFYGYGVDWSPDGKYLAACGSSGISIYSFNGTSLSLFTSTSFGVAYSVKWNPDGRYLAVGGQAGNARVYSFNGKTLNRVATTPVAFSGSVVVSSWSPDGKYLAFLGVDTSNNFRVYSFTGSSLSLVAQRYVSSTVTWGALAWSPDGRYIAVGVHGGLVAGYQYLNIFYFTGSNLVRVTGLNSGTGVDGLAWSADGGYLAVGFASASPDMGVYAFNNSTLTLVGSGFNTQSSFVYGLAWSPNGNFLVIAGSQATRPAVEFNINAVRYARETQYQALSNSIVFGNSALGASYDANVQFLSKANVEIDGLINFDNVN